MAFPLYFLEQVRERINLVDLIGRQIKLQRRGAEWIGLCPFHHEKTPSFHVVPDKNFYHCFGCGAHGDALKFVREQQNLPFLDAVKLLADMAGLEMPKRDPQQQKQEDARDQSVQIMERAASWFHQQLLSNEGRTAREMLKNRGISEAMIAQFQLGYAPQAVQKMLSELALPAKEARELGLAKTGENGDYAFFRERLMFPIRDVRGQTIAFGGRRMREDQPAKYMNSPDTPLFTKREQLYNLDQSKAAARKDGELLVAEGYMDVIALVQAGFPAAVAPLGTALGADQIRRLWRYADSPILCLDGDAAGLRAAGRVAEEAIKIAGADKGLRFALLPSGEDPDSLIKNRGKAAMQQRIDKALPLGEFLWRQYSAGVNFAQPEAVSGLKKRLDDLAGSTEDPYLRSSYRQFWRDQIWQSTRQNNALRQKNTPKLPAQRLYDTTPRSSSAQITARIVLCALINHPSLIAEFAESFSTLDFPEHLDNLRQKLHIYAEKSAQYPEDESSALVDLLKQQHEIALNDVLSREVYIVAPEAAREGSVDEARALLLRLERILYEQCLVADAERLYKEAGSDAKVWQRLELLQKEIHALRQQQRSG